MTNVPNRPDAPTTEVADPGIVAEAERVLRLVHDVVQRHHRLQGALEAAAGEDDITQEAFERSGSSRSWDLLLLAQELIERLTGSNLSDAQLAEQLEREAPLLTRCGCCWAGAANHDRLVEWFSLDSPERSEQLFIEAATWAENDHDGDVSWLDWPDFIAEHNWPNPTATRVVATCMVDIVRRAQLTPAR